MVLVCLFWSLPTSNLILIDVADGSCPVVLDTVFSGPRRPAWRKAVIRLNFSFAVASNDGLFHLSLNGKGVFCIEADAPRKNWLKFPHNDV